MPAGVRPASRSGERGAVTAEVAFAIPVLLATMLFGVWLAGVVIANVRCIDTARDVARAVARGEPLESAQQLGSRTAPRDATITITQSDPDIQVTVSAPITPDWPLLAQLPPLHAQANATIQSEPATARPLP
ncbi:TadE-like protein [Kribbella voronezhensis]|uniref:TadE-like protein n=2 Tax=Kribbella voronezhensis TaxID=2512212 RepID=A0A4R7TB87_9ACTN|nr:TadE-like protein [Kribbella voronezhensis]